MKRLTWGALLLLAGCGRPEIQIDSAKISQAEGNIPVGLVEVHRARSGTSFGLSIGESLNESLFCTGTLLGDGRVLTSADCLRNAKETFVAEDMEFHINEQGAPPTGHWAVERVETDSSRSGLAYLHLTGPEPQVSGARDLKLSDGALALSESNPSLEARTLTVSQPNDDGIAIGSFADTSVQYSSRGFEFPTTPAPEPPRSASGTGTGTSTATDTRTGITIPGLPGGPGGTGGVGSTGGAGSFPGGGSIGGGSDSDLPGSGSLGGGTGGTGGFGTATSANISTSTGIDTDTGIIIPSVPARPVFPYGSGTSTSTSTSTSTATDTATDPPPSRYSPVKALGLSDASVGSPVVVGNEIVGLVRRGSNHEGPAEVYWLDESKNPQRTDPSWEEDRQRERRR